MNAQTERQVAPASSPGMTILHPTDLGPDNAPALAHAVALALATQAQLTLLHIRGADEAGPTRSGLGLVGDLLVRWGKLAPADRFADLRPRLGFSAASLDVPARSVSEGVLEHFVYQPVELAVLVARAHQGLSYWFAGSTSRRTLRQADAMILFLPQGARGFVDAATGAVRLSRALIPLDGRIPPANAIARARGLLDALGPSVEKRLLHIGEAAPADAPRDMPLTVAQGPVAATILHCAERFRSDLIVMPTSGKRGLLSAFRHSVTAEILEDGRWPLLSVPAS